MTQPEALQKARRGLDALRHAADYLYRRVDREALKWGGTIGDLLAVDLLDAIRCCDGDELTLEEFSADAERREALRG